MKTFEAIYKTYYTDIYNFLLKLTGYQSILAEELLQESFYQAFQSFDRFRGDCSIKTWLCQIAKNTFYNYLREAKRQQNIALQYINAQETESIEHLYEKKQLYIHLKQVIDTFDKRTKSIIEYRLFSNMPCKEIAILLDISETTAKVAFSRAKVKIRKTLKEAYGYEI